MIKNFSNADNDESITPFTQATVSSLMQQSSEEQSYSTTAVTTDAVNDEPSSEAIKSTGNQATSNSFITKTMLEHRLQEFQKLLHLQLARFENFINQSQARIDDQVETIIAKLDSFDTQIADFHDKIDCILKQAHHDNEETDFSGRMSYFHAQVEEKVQLASTRISQNSYSQQKAFCEYLVQQKKLFDGSIQVDLQEAIQAAVDTLIVPLLHTHTEEIEACSTEAMLNIESMQQNMLQGMDPKLDSF
jgi:hypothetical protein